MTRTVFQGPREGDPEGAIERENRGFRRWSVDRQLLTEREFDDGLVASAPEESEEITEDGLERAATARIANSILIERGPR